MAAPTWVAGQVLAASDVNQWFVGLYAVKTADQSVTSSVTLVNDTQLLVSVAANTTYLLKGFLLYEGAAFGAGDIQWGWTFPAGLTMRYQLTNISVANAAQTVTMKETGGPNAPYTANANGGTGSAGNVRSAMLFGTVVTAAAAGTLQLQWAQNLSSATSTIMHAQSALTLWRIS